MLNERAPTPEADREASVLYRMLRLKRAHPGPTERRAAQGPLRLLPRPRAAVPGDRGHGCLRAQASRTGACRSGCRRWRRPSTTALARWIEAGAPTARRRRLPPAHAQRVAQWEAFLNADSLKARLASRYIYEHRFLAHLYFDDLPGERVFRAGALEDAARAADRGHRHAPALRRSGRARAPYYRLRRVSETLLAKTHMPYALNDARLARLKAWFIDAPYEVSALPSYEPAVASNPFVAFRELPVEARYRLMLDEAQFTMMGFIKGPVCRGQVALDVINDHFWVMFERPDAGTR